MSIEAKYLEGKARGFKHPAEVAEQLEVLLNLIFFSITYNLDL